MSMWTWFEDDTLWENLESFLFSQFRSNESTVREAEQILTLVHPPQGVAVLDLCCGPGRHALEFARRGFQVTGVDRTTRSPSSARHWGITNAGCCQGLRTIWPMPRRGKRWRT